MVTDPSAQRDFTQSPPQLRNQWTQDRVLQSCLARHLPDDLWQQAQRDLAAMGELAVDLSQQQATERELEPSLEHWDAWGNRIDRITLTPLWETAKQIAATHGLVATAYEGTYQPYGRLIQFALVYLFHPSSDFYTCPLAMTDGATRALLESGNEDLVHRAVSRLTSRDPQQFWTSGQWMTETTGGSDISGTSTIARQDEDGRWRLYGKKWFTSAATSEVALTLARPEDNPLGSKGLALFYLEPRDQQGQLQQIEILRLKDKLGTRKLPTAELRLNGVPAVPVHGLDNGVKGISPMLNVTRIWNAVCAVSMMRRSIALARDYANRRVVFREPLIDQPLHQNTLADMQAEFEAALHFMFYVIRLLGLSENQRLDKSKQDLLRLLTPILKLTTAKQSVGIISEAIETFGGAGYIENTGLPQLLRDAQVFPIWEGTTNVLSLDTVRVLSQSDAFDSYQRTVRKLLDQVQSDALKPAQQIALQSLASIRQWLDKSGGQDNLRQSGARGLAVSLGRTLMLALLLEHAQHELKAKKDPRPAAAAARFSALGVDRLVQPNQTASEMLATDIYA